MSIQLENCKILSNHKIETRSESQLNTDIIDIGIYHKGGIIAYFLNSNDPGYVPGEKHGIIVSPIDCNLKIKWGCCGFEVNGLQCNIGFGQQNTINIISNCPQIEIAARACYNLILNGYSDWYLPSINELEKLYQNLSNINKNALNNLGKCFEEKIYWSSSQLNNHYALALDFNKGKISHVKKNTNCLVRAIRAF